MPGDSHAGARGEPLDAPILSVDSIILALGARFDAGAAHGLRTSYDLRLAEDRFRIELPDDGIELARGGADQADATIDTDPGTLAPCFGGAGCSPTRNAQGG